MRGCKPAARRTLFLRSSQPDFEVDITEIKKKPPSVCRNTSSICEICNLYEKMARDVGPELERNSRYCHQEVLAHWDRAQKSWAAAVSTKRKLEALRAENDHIRQLLARRESSCQPFPRGPFAPAAPPAAQRGREGQGGPLGHQGPHCEGSGIRGRLWD